MLTMPKCHDCGKFCRPVEWQMIYSGALPEPQEEIYKCAACVEKHGSFAPQPGIKPEYSCGKLPTTGATFPDGMTEEDDKEFNRQWNVERMTHNAELTGAALAQRPGRAPG